ncbi:FAD binding domain-containing protein [Bradyrhizobium sp.]|jgi:carbon-monoxide dehydrogenase medium subunit|uniref:FAD binding domain-containing protein n=1 Tax=Bradyrhizobium sp. TaxID=376 RepID=UPI003C13FA02
MKAPPFRYHRPSTIAEAVELLATLDNARAIAGGQSLMPMMNFRLVTPDDLIDLGGIEELVGLTEGKSALSIGAMTTQRRLERSEIVARQCPLITAALRHVGHQQTRNRGTIGGSLCHLDPGAELPVAAAALDAVLIAVGRSGERLIPFAEFSVGLLSNALSPGELLARIELPKAAPRTGVAFVEFNRRPADFAVVSVAASLALDAAGRIAQAAIAVGGSFEAPVRLGAFETACAGRRPEPALFDVASREAEAIECVGDDVYPAEYRRELAGVLVRRALDSALVDVETHADA